MNLWVKGCTRNFPNKDNFIQVVLKNYPPNYLKKILCVKIVYIVKVVPKIIFEIVVKKELFVKVICIIKVMIQIYLSEGTCKK